VHGNFRVGITSSEGSAKLHHSEAYKKEQRGVSWPVKVLLFALVGVAAVFDESARLGGWGGIVAMALIALAIPVSLRQFRTYWKQTRFWITVSLLAILQIPAVVTLRPLIGRAGSASLLGFVILDTILVIVVIVLVCSRSNERN
jgi:hypothetical protein